MKTRYAALCSVVASLLLVSVSAQDSVYSLPGMNTLDGSDDGEASTKSSPTIRYSDRGRRFEVPKGVFHYTDNEQNIEGGFRIPDEGEKMDPMRLISELMQTASKAQTKQNTMSGIYVPMPFGMRPLNLQVSNVGTNGVSFTDEAHPPTKEGLRRAPKKNKDTEALKMSPVARENLEGARRACVSELQVVCDKRLEEYFIARFGHSPMEKSIKAADATLTDPGAIAQTELASWLLPGLRDSLDEIKNGDNSITEDNSREQKPPIRRAPRLRRRPRPSPSPSPPNPPAQFRLRDSAIDGFSSRLSKLAMIPRWN